MLLHSQENFLGLCYFRLVSLTGSRGHISILFFNGTWTQGVWKRQFQDGVRLLFHEVYFVFLNLSSFFLKGWRQSLATQTLMDQGTPGNRPATRAGCNKQLPSSAIPMAQRSTVRAQHGMSARNAHVEFQTNSHRVVMRFMHFFLFCCILVFA